MSALGAILLLAAIAIYLVGLFYSPRRYTLFAVFAVVFVLSDVADLILVGSDAMTTPLQRSWGVPVLSYVLGRMAIIGGLGVLFACIARAEKEGVRK